LTSYKRQLQMHCRHHAPVCSEGSYALLREEKNSNGNRNLGQSSKTWLGVRAQVQMIVTHVASLVAGRHARPSFVCEL
jgi:hypothetical protein